MDKYKIEFTFNKDKDINDIFISVLNKELKKYIQMICKKNVSSSFMQFFPEGGKNC